MGLTVCRIVGSGGLVFFAAGLCARTVVEADEVSCDLEPLLRAEGFHQVVSHLQVLATELVEGQGLVGGRLQLVGEFARATYEEGYAGFEELLTSFAGEFLLGA